ncbi:hypothetical protein M3936_19385 [Sutcliffiella horikoshii]|uniref:hypothetical protein n=1 Tax=Sutcliffiella horikoshii TaxID=79883 RepID=UPI001CBB75F9|nr:hypothetical protein [Sutcliffiella horikoshii]MCM3619737.1 hypothetical protein [Sutcliffiella horikoshii]UAL49890.1 hypothetical protein K7887_22495 [Sutcliffiella horikoshii]
MNTSISTFMKVALTVTVIVACLFMVGYKLVDDETDAYKDIVEAQKSHEIFD